MPRVSDVYPDRFMKARHLEEMDPDAEDYMFSIHSTGETTFPDGKKQIILRFAETNLELGLPKTSSEICAELFKSGESNDWIGKKLVLHVEIVKNSLVPSGKGPAIRISAKATKLANKPASKKPAPPVTQEEADEDIPDDLPF